ncbi:MAG: 4a-hydroxytetrahydrobiopterin dehydratase [Steroidobacteraceae bacterium]|nr:4a-hydroxytetrahydrobiopterin dehydratase [Nevskiaceae bacterium]MCP5339441.1 4a-hydroxytetrahydrobiopterin dehydratase [Nevskiaceae bacterium]MCP5360554.1 4a-hydroxytetrahydrobiopterin dehydratase [Nevskiaceae bacterium]MCP5472901.1 4a-hydroxytetrahydrobiopterin dehydratase [Nevskiaceae bacterium]
MSSLTDKKCAPCEGGVPPLSTDECQALMAQLAPGWVLAGDARQIERRFGFKDFFRTMSFVNALAHIAHLEDHHPDLEVGYNYCHVRYSTHAIDGLSENDFICAAKIDRIPLH